MIKVIRSYERTSADIPFYHEYRGENVALQKHMYENYVLTKKFVGHSQSMSEDKLRYTSITTWATTDDFFDFSTDVALARLVEMDLSKKYEEDKGITLTITIEHI